MDELTNCFLIRPQELSKMIPKSEVEVLSADSKNIVSLIRLAYDVSFSEKIANNPLTSRSRAISNCLLFRQRLSSKVTMAHDDLPPNVRVTYTPICPKRGPAGEEEGVCNGVLVGQQVSRSLPTLCVTDPGA